MNPLSTPDGLDVLRREMQREQERRVVLEAWETIEAFVRFLRVIASWEKEWFWVAMADHEAMMLTTTKGGPRWWENPFVGPMMMIANEFAGDEASRRNP